MLDELAEGGVLSTALRVICNPEESRGAVEDGEYKLAVADILSIGEYHKSIFFDIYKEFESVGAMLFDYNLKIPKRRDELLGGGAFEDLSTPSSEMLLIDCKIRH